MSVAIFDIDGVVADVRHRLHYLQRRPKDWGGFFMDAGEDSPLTQGICLVDRFTADHDIVWLTGRPDWLRQLTVDWLREQSLPATELIMRRRRDYRPARIVKVEALQRLAHREIASFVDDDPAVISAAVAAGFTATLADWVPRSTSLDEAQEQSGRT